jgi:hypothetical protein
MKATEAIQTVAGQMRAVPPNGDQPGGARLLRSDVRVGWLLLDEARFRSIERVFGVPRDQAFLLTLVGIGTLAEAARRKAARLVSVPGAPSLAHTVISAAMYRESAHRVAGTWSRDSPAFGTLIAIAMVGASARPVLGASSRAIRASTHAAQAGFDHRYGHLIRRNGHLH